MLVAFRLITMDALANGGVQATGDSMFAVWIVQLLIALLLCVAVGCFLREHGINCLFGGSL